MADLDGVDVFGLPQRPEDPYFFPGDYDLPGQGPGAVPFSPPSVPGGAFVAPVAPPPARPPPAPAPKPVLPDVIPEQTVRPPAAPPVVPLSTIAAISAGFFGLIALFVPMQGPRNRQDELPSDLLPVIDIRPPKKPPVRDTANDFVMPPNWEDLLDENTFTTWPDPLFLSPRIDRRNVFRRQPSVRPEPRPSVPVRPAPAVPRPDDDLDEFTVTAPRYDPRPTDFPTPNLAPYPTGDPGLSPFGDPFFEPRTGTRAEPAPRARPAPRPLLEPFPYEVPLGRPTVEVPPRVDVPRTRVPTPQPPTFVDPVPLDPISPDTDPYAPTAPPDQSGCDCTKVKGGPKKKRKKKEPRTECRRGTYQQTRKGIIYHPKETIPCQ